MNVRKRIWEIIEVAKPGDKASRRFDIGILGLIFLNVIAVIIGSVPSMQLQWAFWLNAFEVLSVGIFTLEYLTRLWACTSDLRFRSHVGGRVRFALQAIVIFDLLAILPFYLPFLSGDLRSLRVLRFLRALSLFRAAKLARYVSSLKLIKQVLQSKKEELVLTAVMMGLLLVVSSTVLYFCENAANPLVFSSIPASMWWSVETLTTVGFGDMVPITAMGKFFGSIIAILGIGMFALPAGIIGAGFVEAVQRKKAGEVCQHCGKAIH
ncbi:MAG: voltage-gated potassium channel [Candidatus Binatia bacterium]|jgi:voltage-gated potassium channel